MGRTTVERYSRGPDELQNARAGARAGGHRSGLAGKRQRGTYVVVSALLLEGLLGEDVTGAEEGERGRALGDHWSPDERCTACHRSAQHPICVPRSAWAQECGWRRRDERRKVKTNLNA